MAEKALPTPPQIPEVVATNELIWNWGACISGEIVMQVYNQGFNLNQWKKVNEMIGTILHLRELF